LALTNLAEEGKADKLARVRLGVGAQDHPGRDYPVMLPRDFAGQVLGLGKKLVVLRLGEILSRQGKYDIGYSPHRRLVYFPRFPGHAIGTAVVHPIFGLTTGAEARFVIHRESDAEDLLGAAARGKFIFDLDPTQKGFSARLLQKDVPFGSAEIQLTEGNYAPLTMPLGFLPDTMAEGETVEVYVYADPRELRSGKVGVACPVEKHTVLRSLRQYLLKNPEPFLGEIISRRTWVDEVSLTIRFLFGDDRLYGRISLPCTGAENYRLDDELRVRMDEGQMKVLRQAAELSPLMGNYSLLVLLCHGFHMQLA
jgi:hypothetical protein